MDFKDDKSLQSAAIEATDISSDDIDQVVHLKKESLATVKERDSQVEN
jgi:hypothetical protein